MYRPGVAKGFQEAVGTHTHKHCNEIIDSENNT